MQASIVQALQKKILDDLDKASSINLRDIFANDDLFLEFRSFVTDQDNRWSKKSVYNLFMEVKEDEDIKSIITEYIRSFFKACNM